MLCKLYIDKVILKMRGERKLNRKRQIGSSLFGTKLTGGNQGKFSDDNKYQKTMQGKSGLRAFYKDTVTTTTKS